MKRTNDFHVIGIDPGIQGAIVAITRNKFAFWNMPIEQVGKRSEIDYFAFKELLKSVARPDSVIVLEVAIALAMGSTHAFNYGRGFAALEIAIKELGLTAATIRPHIWCAELHEGISQELKPKVRAALAVEKLYPKFAKLIPRSKKGKMHEGVVDALLIAGYGVRHFLPPKEPLPEF